jgi:hypothetical protein
MSRVAAYRSYAAECLALAEKTTLENERRSLIEMAASWHELALMLESYMEEHGGEEPAFNLDIPRRPDRRH